MQKSQPRLEVKQLLNFRRPVASRSSVIIPRLACEIEGKRGLTPSDPRRPQRRRWIWEGHGCDCPRWSSASLRFEWKIYWVIGAAEAMSLLSTVITSPPDRESCVVEIWAGSSQLAEVPHEPGRSIEIEI